MWRQLWHPAAAFQPRRVRHIGCGPFCGADAALQRRVSLVSAMDLCGAAKFCGGVCVRGYSRAIPPAQSLAARFRSGGGIHVSFVPPVAPFQPGAAAQQRAALLQLLASREVRARRHRQKTAVSARGQCCGQRVRKQCAARHLYTRHGQRTAVPLLPAWCVLTRRAVQVLARARAGRAAATGIFVCGLVAAE